MRKFRNLQLDITLGENMTNAPATAELSDDQLSLEANKREVKSLIYGNPISFAQAIEEKDINKFYYMQPGIILQLNRHHNSIDSRQTNPVELLFYRLDGSFIRRDSKRYEPTGIFMHTYDNVVIKAPVYQLTHKPSFIRIPNTPGHNIAPPLHTLALA